MEPSLIVTIVLAAIGVIVWLVRLEGRVNNHDASLKEFREDIRYIRDRIDRAVK